MNHDRYEERYILDILSKVRTVAIVGASANTVRPSYFVMKYLHSKGFDVIPVNPGHAGKEIGGLLTYGKLAEIDRAVDMVDIFRNSEAAAAVVDEALELEQLPKVIWMQLGVRNDAAAVRAEARGVQVVMNRCRKPELASGFQRFGLDKRKS
jgi:predicted CoA-binding protein